MIFAQNWFPDNLEPSYRLIFQRIGRRRHIKLSFNFIKFHLLKEFVTLSLVNNDDTGVMHDL